MVRNQTVLVNGSFEHTISALDRGFSYGDGVFRTMRMHQGLPVDWPLHYQKLVADCAVIGIVCPSAELLMHDFQKLFEMDAITRDGMLAPEDAVAKIMITRGEAARGYAPPAVTVPTRVLIRSAKPQYPDSNYQQGVRLHLCDIRLAAQPKLAGIKHLNRLENILARMEWRDEGVFEGLLLDQHDNVIECTMSNLFARFGNRLVTPDLRQCGVAGVTRQRIIELAWVLNLSVEVGILPLATLLEADEVLICNSLYGAFQVVELQKNTWSEQNLASEIRVALGL